MTAGFLKCAFTSQNTKSPESLKANPFKFRNSLKHPEGFHILKGLNRLVKINSFIPKEPEPNGCSPGFIDMVCKSIIKSRNKVQMIRRTQLDDDRALETERSKVIQLIQEGSNLTSRLAESDFERSRIKKKSVSVLAKKRKVVDHSTPTYMVTRNIPKLLMPLEPIDPKLFGSLSPIPYSKNLSPKNIHVSERLYPKSKVSNTHKSGNQTERIRSYQSPYLIRANL